MDSKTVFGYYFSLLNTFQGFFVGLFLWISALGFLLGLCIYVDAFSGDFKAIISQINDEITFETEKSLKSQVNKNSSGKLTEAILLHHEMLK